MAVSRSNTALVEHTNHSWQMNVLIISPSMYTIVPALKRGNNATAYHTPERQRAKCLVLCMALVPLSDAGLPLGGATEETPALIGLSSGLVRPIQLEWCLYVTWICAMGMCHGYGPWCV